MTHVAVTNTRCSQVVAAARGKCA